MIIESKQHVQLPNGSDIDPYDQLVYVNIRRYINKNGEAFPSLDTICKDTGLSINPVRNSIKVLEEKKYFDIEKRGRQNVYLFNELKAFEPFSYEFLDREDLTTIEKAFIIATQQYMFKDIEGIGKIGYSYEQLAELIHWSEHTIRRTIKSLERKNFLTMVKNKSTDLVTGCNTKTKVFDMNSLGQAIIWKLREHEERITNTEDRVDTLEKQLLEQQKLINKLLAERNINQIIYKL